MNLRGNYKPIILEYINKKFPELSELYSEIYRKKNMTYWFQLDKKISEYAKREGIEYFYNRDDLQKDFDDPPTIINFFFHEKIKKTPQKI